MSFARGRFAAEEALSLICRDVEDDNESGDDDDNLFELCSPDDFDDESNPDDAEDDSDDQGEEAESDCSSNSTSRGRPRKSSRSTGGQPRAKRLRTQQRLVNSIDSALDQENFDDLELPEEGQCHTYCAKLGPARKKNVEKIFWTDEQQEPRGRQRECDILKGKPGLRSNAAKAVKSPRDAF